MPREKFSVTLDDVMIERINNFVSKEKSMSGKFNDILRDYFAMLDRAKKEVLHAFTESELNYIYDAFNGTILLPELSFKTLLIAKIEDANKFDRLSEKWNVDMDKFLSELNSLSEFECYAICKIAEEFWSKH
ncbi:hypothetical protein [Thermoanaerobacterium thermosaccharolyticum]|uniref:hypothetical protein n=1 Tax=Thermoanaerobacterium thermosaccharolyticum TaxID=1517 RepID=UPI002FDB716D